MTSPRFPVTKTLSPVALNAKLVGFESSAVMVKGDPSYTGGLLIISIDAAYVSDGRVAALEAKKVAPVIVPLFSLAERSTVSVPAPSSNG